MRTQENEVKRKIIADTCFINGPKDPGRNLVSVQQIRAVVGEKEVGWSQNIKYHEVGGWEMASDVWSGCSRPNS